MIYFRRLLIGLLLLLTITYVGHNKSGIDIHKSAHSDSLDTVENLPKTLKEKGSIKRGETLSSILNAHQISKTIHQSIIKSFNQIYSVRYLKPGHQYEIEKDSSGLFLSMKYFPNIDTEYIVSFTDSGHIVSSVNKIKLVKKVKYLTGQIKSSLYESIVENGESPELLVMFTDIFQWDIDFFIDPRVGDLYRIVYEKLYLPDNDKFVKYGKILSAQYTLNNDTLTAIYFDNHPEDDGYYDLNGQSFQKTFLKSPLNYRRISSHFSYSRRHPILKIRRPHYGVDYAAPSGTPVSAAANGIVIKKGYDKGIGRFVKIRHKNSRFVTLYGHLSRFGAGIQESARVEQKQIIGYVGKTGLATGPHLHYAFYDNGRPIDPLKIKNTSGEPVSKENQAAFQKKRVEMLAQLKRIDLYKIPLVLNTASYVHFNRYSIPSR